MIGGKLLQLIQTPSGDYEWALYWKCGRFQLSIMGPSGGWIVSLDEQGKPEGNPKAKPFESIEAAGLAFDPRKKGKGRHGREKVDSET